MRRLLGGVLLPVLMLTAACEEDPEPAARLVDASGAVREWVYHPPPSASVNLSSQQFARMEEHGAVAVAAPEGWDIRLVWGALKCNTAPTIHVSGAGGIIDSIVVNYGVVVPEGSGCGDELVLHVIDMRVDPGAGTDVVVSGRGS